MSLASEATQTEVCATLLRFDSDALYRLLALMQALALIALVLFFGACRQDMHDQPKYKPLEASQFFADGQSARHLVAGTMPYQPDTNQPAQTAAAFDPIKATTLPMPLTQELLERGEERYNISCSPCHGYTGDGKGMIVQRGFQAPPSYHTDRLRTAPVGHFFDVITNGFGAMPPYADQVAEQDRWAIIAYIRALQLSQNASINNVPPAERGKLNAGGQPK